MGKNRRDEHEAFLTWLLETVEKEHIDLLIVAGDIFDTGTPPNYALELYYNTLTKLAASSCQNIIVIAGNHDSIATLKAPKQLLEALHIHVIASGDASENKIIPVLKDGELTGIVCAVPFLHDYVVRQSLNSESMSDKESALSKGIKEHYKEVYNEALQRKGTKDIPIIATGHLTTLGAKRSESERDIYIGNTLNIDSDFFGNYFDYVALGHLHINQKVGSEHVRYSGSPIPLSFSEAASQKKVNIVEFKGTDMRVRELDVPLYRPLLVLRGDSSFVMEQLESIDDKRTWLEVHLNDANPFHANERIRAKAQELDLTLLAVKIDKQEQMLGVKDFDVISLDELKPIDVFERRLQKEEIEDEAFEKELLLTFKKVVDEVQNR